MLDHANLNAMCGAVIDGFEMTADDHSLLILPLFHVNGIVVGTLSPLLAGGRATIAGRFKADTFFDRIAQSRATYFSAVPTIYTMLCGLPASVKPDTSSVRFAVCGAAPASVELLEGFESRYGIPIIEGYGLSEGSCASTVNPLSGKRKAGNGRSAAARPDDPVGRRVGYPCARRRGRRGRDQRREHHAGVSESTRGDREHHRRRLAAHR